MLKLAVVPAFTITSCGWLVIFNSTGATVGFSVGASVGASVGFSVGASVSESASFLNKTFAVLLPYLTITSFTS